VDVVSAVNAGVAAATAREGFRMADAEAASPACGDLGSAKASGRADGRPS
jgi:hypothetical protein